MGVKGGDPAAWENMAASAEKLLKQAKGETDVTLLKRLAEDGAKVEREVGALMASFNAESSAALAQLSRQAGLAPAADLAKIQFLTMANAEVTPGDVGTAGNAAQHRGGHRPDRKSRTRCRRRWSRSSPRTARHPARYASDKSVIPRPLGPGPDAHSTRDRSRGHVRSLPRRSEGKSGEQLVG